VILLVLAVFYPSTDARLDSVRSNYSHDHTNQSLARIASTAPGVSP